MKIICSQQLGRFLRNPGLRSQLFNVSKEGSKLTGYSAHSSGRQEQIWATDTSRSACFIDVLGFSRLTRRVPLAAYRARDIVVIAAVG